MAGTVYWLCVYLYIVYVCVMRESGTLRCSTKKGNNRSATNFQNVILRDGLWTNAATNAENFQRKCFAFMSITIRARVSFNHPSSSFCFPSSSCSSVPLPPHLASTAAARRREKKPRRNRKNEWRKEKKNVYKKELLAFSQSQSCRF